MLPPLPSARDQPDLWADWINAAFAEQPHRAAHLRRAYAEACRLPMTALTLEERRTVRLAALVHDVGRAVDPTDGLPHAISGALLIEVAGLPIVAAAVAHHSGALLDLAERGLPEGLLSPWPRDERLASVLTYLDAISGAMGQVVTVEARLADIVARYGEASRQVRAFRATLAEIERGRALSA